MGDKEGSSATGSGVAGMFAEILDGIRQKGLFRQLRPLDSAQGPWVQVDGRRVLNMCSNNYLGLAGHPRVVRAGEKALREWGAGSGASRLICGTLGLHQALERRIACFKETESALVYTSGYTANVGIISALVGKDDLVFSDELNHASLIDGCRLSRATTVVFPHNDLNALESKLQLACKKFGKVRRLIVVDGVFSMDGDVAPLAALVDLSERYDCMLMLDEAHAVGALGPGGRGLAASLGLEKRVPVLMGTLSKALGGFGGYAAGTAELSDFLINTSRSFIFATALPPASAACAMAALDILDECPELPAKLQSNGDLLRQKLRAAGFDTLNSETQIIPVVIGDAARTVEMSRLLFERGILATAIRPPTVPEGTSRVRVAVMATHTDQDLELAAEAFAEAGRELGLI